MKKLTKNLAKELLKDNNYMEALAYFAERYSKFKTEEEKKKKREEDYDKLINWAYDFEEEDFDNDYSGNALAIDSAMYIAITDNYND